MKTILTEILSQCIGLELLDAKKIEVVGTINKLYKVSTSDESYIIRINENSAKFKNEYKKEKWCINEITKLGIESPQVIQVGEKSGYAYMVMNSVEGHSGLQSIGFQRINLWNRIGHYTSQFNSICGQPFGDMLPFSTYTPPYTGFLNQIKFNYNKLNSNDPLLLHGHLSTMDHKKIKSVLREISEHHFQFGLVHGDLSLRNIIVTNDKVTLLNWEFAEINVVPHTEFLQLLHNNEITEGEMVYFLKGLGIEQEEYEEMLPMILKLNLLKRLDKYRWAEKNMVQYLGTYVQPIKHALGQIPCL